MRAPNYIADRNPFSLAAPPSWWLRGLYAFDPQLVLIPSRKEPVFILARRRLLSRALGAVIDRQLGVDDPANVMPSRLCDAYGCVVVTTIVCLGAWTTSNLQLCLDELRARDAWALDGPLDEAGQRKAAFEGGSKLTRAVDAHDDAERARTNRQVRADCYAATGDAWRSRQARRGERILNAGRPSQPATRGAIATPKPMPTRRLIGV